MTIPECVVKYRWIVIAGFVAAAIASALQLRRASIESDVQKLLPETMSSRANSRAIEDLFGSTDMLFFVVESDDVLAETTLQRLAKIDARLSRIDGVADVLSLFSTKSITAQDGSMIVEPVITDIPATETEREALRNRIRGNELAYKLVVSEDFRFAAFLMTPTPGADEDAVYRSAQAVFDSTAGSERVYAGGQPLFRSIIRADVARDITLLVPVALLIMLGTLFAFFRQIRGVVLPFAAVALSMMFGMGLLPLFGWEITLLTVLLPIMIVAIANNYGIHLVAAYQELGAQPGKHTGAALAKEVLRRLWRPVLITGLTTIVGILGLLSHVMLPARQIGIAAAIAVAFALALSLCAIPAALSVMKIPGRCTADSSATGNGWVHRLLSETGIFIKSRPKTILLFTALITAIGIAGTLLVSTDANQENLFARNHPISKTTRLINENFGGAQSISLHIRGDIKDPALLSRISGYQKDLEQMEGVSTTTSIADVIRIMSRALNDRGDVEYDRIPSSRNAVAQYVELYSMSGDPDDFERMVDFNYENAHCIIRINNGSTPVVKKIVDRINSIMETDTTIVRMGGFAVILAQLADTMIRGQIVSLIFAVAAIAVLMMMLFRSPAAGLLSAVPLSISAILGFGAMGIFGIRFDIAMAMVTSIVIGAGVDYTIHFLWRYRAERRSGKPYNEAVCHTLTTSGRGIMFNALSVVAGFGALFLSSMPPLRSFALLFSLSILTCMAGALVVVPCLCLVIKPKFLEP